MKRRGGRPVIAGLAIALAALLAAGEWSLRSALAAASGGLAEELGLLRHLLWAVAVLAAVALGWLWRFAGEAAMREEAGEREAGEGGAVAPARAALSGGHAAPAGRSAAAAGGNVRGGGSAASGAAASGSTGSGPGSGDPRSGRAGTAVEAGAPARADPVAGTQAGADGPLEGVVRYLQTRREAERHRLARELHDELGALLTAAKLDAARVRSRLPQPVLPEVLDRLRHMDEALNQGIALKRRVIEELRPSSLDNLGLTAALEILIGEFGDRTGVQTDMDLHPVELVRDSQLTVFRLVQEALDNVERHAGATRVRVTLAPDDGRARLRISDDGIGFAAGPLDLRTPALLALGLRVRAEGGALQVTSAANAGTTVDASLPLRQPG